MIAMALALPFTGMAQGKITRTWRSIQEKNIFSHIDVSATVGTTGFGFDLATPVTNWAQLRVGGVFRWHTTMDATLDIATPQTLENDPRMKKLIYSMMPQAPEKTINMQGTFAMNNMKVLAEGVETSEELCTVVSYGVDYIQGYYTGRPAPDPLDEIFKIFDSKNDPNK